MEGFNMMEKMEPDPWESHGPWPSPSQDSGDTIDFKVVVHVTSILPQPRTRRSPPLVGRLQMYETPPM